VAKTPAAAVVAVIQVTFYPALASSDSHVRNENYVTLPVSMEPLYGVRIPYAVIIKQNMSDTALSQPKLFLTCEQMFTG